jgi:hypothetical protein
MLKLKSVRLPVLEAAVRVSVAEIDWPAFRTVLCRFHVRVSTVLAVVGTQLPVVMVRLTGSVPVFFTYIVLVVELPGYSVPQFIDVKFWVHPMSE